MVGEWIETTVGEFSPFSYGKNLPAEKRNAGTVPVVSSAGVSGLHSEAFVKTKGIVIGRKGTVGSLTYCDRPFWPIDTAFYIVDEPKKRDLRFTFYLLHTLNLSDMNSDSAVPGLNRDSAHAREIRIPPLEEQKRIAEILGALDDKIELNRKMNATLEQMARALFQSWFVDFDPVHAKADGRQPIGMDKATADLFPDSFEDSELGKIPKGWEVQKIESLCEVITSGGTPQRMHKSYWEPATIPWFKTGELLDGPLLDAEEKISEDGLSNSSCKLWPAGTILFALYASPTVGRFGVLTKPGTANQAAAALIAKNEYGVPFLMSLLHSARTELQRIAVGAAQQNINQGVLKSHRAIVPPTKLAKIYSCKVTPLFEKRIEIAKQSRTLATLRDTLLPKLLSGELSVKELNSKISV